MAKDAALDEKAEDYQFEVPDFDEEAFIHKEMTSFKTTAVLFAWGILAALTSWVVFFLMDGAKTAWYLGLGILLVFLYGLRVVYPKLNIDVAHFKRREWMGTGFLLFFTWLAFFILFANPPISDFAEPHVMAYETPGAQLVGGDLSIDIFASDNGHVEEMVFVLTQGATTIATFDDLVHVGGDHYRYTLENATGGNYAYSFTATDSKGNQASITGEATVAQKAIQVILPASGKLQLGDNLFVKTIMPACEGDQFRDGGECLRTVYADIGDGIHLKYSQDDGAWLATSNFAGWAVGKNQFNIVAETQTQFHGANTIAGTEMTVGPYNLTVDSVGDLKETPAALANVPPAYRQTPGFEVPLLLAGLVGLVILRRK